MRSQLLLGWHDALVLLVVGLAAGSSLAAEWHVTADGAPTGEGTGDKPWDLNTALAGAPDTSQAPRIRPGDTVWLHEGIYKGAFGCQLRGEPDRPITFRALPGQRVTLDSQELFTIDGAWTVFWGFELTCSDPKRVTTIKGPWPDDIRRGGIHSRASHVKFINLVVHDSSQGFGFWADGEGGEIYGCVIYNNGWRGPDRGHGHGIYTQNKTGAKRLCENILFNQFGYGIHAYGSEKASLQNIHLEGNVSFLNGAAAGREERAPAIFVGGGGVADAITLANNFTWGDEHGGGSVRLGYTWSQKRNIAATIRDNYIVGGVDLLYWLRLAFTGNTVVAPWSLVHLFPAEGADLAEFHWDENRYFRTDRRWDTFALAEGEQLKALEFSDWQKTGLDTHSTYAADKPKESKVFIRPNQYEPGRAHLIVYNWQSFKEVKIDLAGILQANQPYRIVSAQDFFGEPVVKGVFHGEPVLLPMTERRAPPPIGMPDFLAPVTGPAFGVFVVLPE